MYDLLELKFVFYCLVVETRLWKSKYLRLLRLRLSEEKKELILTVASISRFWGKGGMSQIRKTTVFFSLGESSKPNW